MADLPILFSAPMVRAILREIEQPGTGKTQTRRVLTRLRRFGPILEFGRSDTPGYDWHFRDKGMRWHDLRNADLSMALPYTVGDRLYVREAHHRTNDHADSHLVGYDFAEGPVTRADRHHVDGAGSVQFFHHSLGGWGGRLSRNYPAMHMPRWASRVTLIVTEVRVQRLQEITNEDCIAEGIPLHPNANAPRVGPVQDEFGRQYDLISHYGGAFVRLWNGINASRGYGAGT